MPDLSLLFSGLVRVEAELSSIDPTPAGERLLDKEQLMRTLCRGDVR